MKENESIYMDFVNENNLVCEKYAKGSYLFQQDEPVDYIFLLKKGHVFILRDNLVLWTANREELIGISSYVSSLPTYSFSARSNSESWIYRIPIDLFQKELNSNSSISLVMMKELCQRIERINDKTRIFKENSSRDRLIKLILEQSKTTGSLTLSFHIKELSELVGISRRMIKSMIFELESKKMIRYFRGDLEILDPRGLEIISQSSI